MNSYKNALKEIREEYVGMDGIPIPLTACEGYLLTIIKRMYKISVKALKKEKKGG